MKDIFTRFLLLILSLCVIALGCKTEQNSLDVDLAPVDGDYTIFILNKDADIAVIKRFPELKIDVMASGERNSVGILTKINTSIIYNPNTKDWVATGYEKGYPVRITTSNGYLIDLKNYDYINKTVDLTLFKDGTVLKENVKQKLSESFFNYAENNPIKGVRLASNNCKIINDVAQGIGIAVNLTVVLMAVATPLGVAGGISVALAAYSAADGIAKITTQRSLTERVFKDPVNQDYAKYGQYAINFLPIKPSDMTKKLIDDIAGNMNKITDALGLPGFLPCNPPANSWGDPHLTTFDGISYDFQGYGEFIAAKSTDDNFEVQVRQEDVTQNGRATFNTGIAFQTGTDVVCVTAKPDRLFINNQLQNLSIFTKQALKDGASISKIKENGFDVLNIINKNSDLVKIRFQNSNLLDLSIYLSENRNGKVYGLLGNFDADKTNDIQIRYGENILINGSIPFDKLYPTYADSWRITQANSLFYYDSGTNTDTYTQKDFPRTKENLTAEQKTKAEGICRAAGVSMEPFLSNCIYDVAITNNPDMTSSSLWGQKNDNRGSVLPTTIIPSTNQSTIIDFNNIKQIELKGEAKIVSNCIRLNGATYSSVGAAYYKSILTSDFETEFTFKVSELRNGGADGFTFIISKDIPELSSGGGIGYEGTKSSLVVEFDTWQNSNIGDPNDNHISIHTNGQEANSPNEKYSIGINDKITNISDAQLHTVKIIYQNKAVEVFLDGKSIVKANIDLTSKLGLNGSFYIGFTASTGGASEIHDICSWTVKNL